MEGRFSNITERYKEPGAFLAKIEKINNRMEACYKKLDGFDEKSLSGRIQLALGRNPYIRLNAYKEEWRQTTGQLHPFISDRDGKPVYLSSFLDGNRLKSHINMDFYHIPES